METLMGLITGIGLSAACGFRVFVPLLGMSIAGRAGHLTLAPGFEWIESWPALISFATATVLEICAYYMPWVDNVLDTAATPAAIVAGTIVTASQIGEMSPLVQWSLALIAGGGTCAVIQGGTVATRATSTVTTGGLGNFAVSTLEGIAATAMTVFATFVPILCFVIAIAICFVMIRMIARSRRIRQNESMSG